MKDKRRASRVPLDIFLNKFVSGVPYIVRTSNICRDGIGLLRSIEPLHLNKRVGLQFQLPGSDEVIYAEGELVREWMSTSHKRGDGIRFTLLTERHRRMIESYVARHA